MFSKIKNLLRCKEPLRCLQQKHAATMLGLNRNGPIHTITEVEENISKRLGLESGYRPVSKSREYLLQYTPKLEDLPPRSIKDSLCSMLIPLSTDIHLLDRYSSHRGRVRIGRLMEAIDLFAVWICHMHVYVPNLPPEIHLPYSFVTVLVDNVELAPSSKSFDANRDILLTGYVTRTGTTSMEIDIYVEQKEDDKYYIQTTAIFVMVARNATGTGPAPINPLQAADDNERQIIEKVKKRGESRMAKSAESVLRDQPTPLEQMLMHELFKRTSNIDNMHIGENKLPPNCCWMLDTFQRTTLIPYPEHRNRHNTVFGGYIMRCALEIARIAARVHCKGRPAIQYIADITFQKPIHVDSIVRMTAYIVYTYQTLMQIMTVVDYHDYESDKFLTANVLHFTYAAEKNVDEVLPKSFHEIMWYLHGRRKFLQVLTHSTGHARRVDVDT